MKPRIKVICFSLKHKFRLYLYFLEKLPEKRPIGENGMVIAKLPSGKLVGINYKRIEDCKSEYEYVIQEEFYAQDLLNKVNQAESGAIDIEENSAMFVTNLKFDETDLEEYIKTKIFEWKEERFNLLKTECSLLDLDTKIKACCGLDKAEPKKALEYLNLLNDLNIESIMLKKHSHIVEMIKRLRKYIGNVQEWKLSDEALKIFEEDAKSIRVTAESIYQKFKVQFLKL